MEWQLLGVYLIVGLAVYSLWRRLASTLAEEQAPGSCSVCPHCAARGETPDEDPTTPIEALLESTPRR